MNDSEDVARNGPVGMDRFAILEKRVAALEKLIATTGEALEFKLRNMKRDLGTLSRNVTQRGGGGHD